MTSFLDIRNVSKQFKGFKALEDVSLSIPKGQRRAIIGPNGAGKSTLISIVGGQQAADSGEIHFDGRNIVRTTPFYRARKGIGRSFQLTSVFLSMTVLENVTSALNACSPGRLGFARARLANLEEKAYGVLVDVGLDGVAHEIVDRLSHGDRKRLELAMVLAIDPTMLVLDEPTAGMGMRERESIMELVRKLVEVRGLTLMFVEHDIDAVFRLAEVITVMAQGRVVVEAAPDEIATNRQVQQIYLGTRAVK